MINAKRKITVQILFTLSLALGATEVNASLACINKLGGSWNFGTVPNACNISPLQTQSFVKSQYLPVIYDDAKAARTARTGYIRALYPVVRDVAADYIRRRNPKVSVGELEGFQQAVFALAAQESFWSHYRKGKDGIIRSMRGDSLHGYGIMQLDDRSHAPEIKDGKGTDLIFNIVAGLDYFYGMWTRSATAKCVSSATDYRDRARSAWAAYNGGAGSLCRWTNSKSKFADHDKDFYQKFTARPYMPYIASTTIAPAIDVRCLVEGVRPCAAP